MSHLNNILGNFIQCFKWCFIWCYCIEHAPYSCSAIYFENNIHDSWTDLLQRQKINNANNCLINLSLIRKSKNLFLVSHSIPLLDFCSSKKNCSEMKYCNELWRQFWKCSSITWSLCNLHLFSATILPSWTNGNFWVTMTPQNWFVYVGQKWRSSPPYFRKLYWPTACHGISIARTIICIFSLLVIFWCYTVHIIWSNKHIYAQATSIQAILCIPIQCIVL